MAFKLKFSLIPAFLFLVSLSVLNAQFVPRQPDYVYKSNIRFPEIFRGDVDMSQPVIELNSGQTLTIRFDDLNQGTQSYSYSVIHCTHDWKPSDLLFMQYMRGFETYEIFNYHFSSNATQPYTHYEFTFPNENMSPTISGNYLIKVFETGDPDAVIFTRRFMVLENKATISAKIRYASDVALRSTHQELYFSINLAMLSIQDVYNDLKVVITQNHRWDNAITDLRPQFVSNGMVQYNYTGGETCFPAGNQYRFLDLKTMQLITEPILKIDYNAGRYHFLLRTDLPRATRNFQMLPDINGRYIVYNQDTYGTGIDPDYAFLYFSLKAEEPYAQDVYLTGGFTFGELLDQYRMQYNAQAQQYELVTQLKQGYYNFMYALKDKKTGKGDVSQVEGSFAEAENDYAIYVYARQPGELAHKLVGLTYLNSLKDR